MAVRLDHIIVPAHDKKTSAEFLAGILGLEVSPQYGPFLPLVVGNEVTLDFMDSDDVHWQHCAFLVEEAEFDEIFARIKASGATFYAHPDRSGIGEINHQHGGRGVYFDDPAGHAMEVLTAPYS
ncbi:VOC family protein [Amycolatopsis cihanbeyliensis]|uniref:Glyoxalase/bleomycin resistance protein/dioxygenase superfamily protein n=1 Tax=Amycolatopsis cihanbeyliensis TaxID=1128664 RepID=A0A542DLR9_AMYCI|nr:VOC family protein [Amycolatopsis cihanbeyliensis]TQJ04018.1 glyoxalase/bleomycin resistance protein/dioxygenase superfamily protein [Amycolatopsis cihanbeyliensis]